MNGVLTVREREVAVLAAAVVVLGSRRVWFPCRSHDGGVHNFAARWPKCEGPWCRLAPGHLGLHDIPSGTVEYHDAIGVIGHG